MEATELVHFVLFINPGSESPKIILYSGKNEQELQHKQCIIDARCLMSWTLVHRPQQIGMVR
jgi:hypothetical protein